MNKFEGAMPTIDSDQEEKIEKNPETLTQEMANQEVVSQEELAQVQKKLDADQAQTDLETMKLREEIAQEGQVDTKAEEHERSERLKAYTEQGFQILIDDLQDQIDAKGIGSWFSPKNEMREKLANLIQKKDSFSDQSVIPSWNVIMTEAKFNRSNRVKKDLENLEKTVLGPGDLDNIKDGMQTLEDQIKSSQVKLSGE